MPRKTLLALLPILPLFTAGLCCAQVVPGNRSYVISGSVHDDATNQPLAEARVQLFDENGNAVHPMIVTGARGEFSFGQFHPGEYELTVEHDGYQPTRLHLEISRHDESSLVLRLRPDAAGVSPAGNTVTAHQLSVPQKAREAFDKGVQKLNDRDYKAALNQFQRAINLYPDYYEAHAQIGIAEMRLKNLPAAEAALRKSIALSSAKYPPPLLALAMLLNDQNRAPEAEPIARQAASADPKTWRAPYELSRALLAQRHLPDAEASSYVARDLKPDSPDVYLLLSEIHRRTHNPEALMQDFDAYLRLAPQGQAAPQVRKLREQLLVYLRTEPKPAPTP